jgi:hypothetical protein
MKQVKLDNGQLNPAMVDFAAHQGFAIKTCRIRRARTKGKVERMVDYVKDNFLNGREFIDLDDLNAQGMNWLDSVANVRVHATTGHRPVDLHSSEKPKLVPIESIRPYTFIQRHPRKVAAESMVAFASSRYSLPPAYVGRTVEVSHESQKIIIRSGDLIVAEHPHQQQAFADWAQVFAGDAVMASAALDRLLHRATVINIRGESFRLKERKRADSRDGQSANSAGQNSRKPAAADREMEVSA